MIREAIATGRSVDEAIDAACAELGVSRDKVEMEIIDLPKKGFLGLTHSPAKAKVWIEVKDPPKPVVAAPAPKAPAPRAVTPASPAPKAAFSTAVPAPRAAAEEMPVSDLPPQDLGPVVPITERGMEARDYLTQIVSAMKLGDGEVEAIQHEGVIILSINGDATGTAIGRRGETLDALQYLTSLAANRAQGDYCRVIVDSGNYRDKRHKTLEQLAYRLAKNALKTGRPTTLEPMNPYERRIIHAAVSQIEGAVSTSIGVEPNRCVVINSATSTIKPSARPNMRGPRTNNNDRPRRDGGKPFTPRSGNGGNRDNRDDRDNRREKPPVYQESSVREVAPSEASDQPLYGKIEL